MPLAILLLMISIVPLTGCEDEPKVDICVVHKDMTAHCFPVNQKGKPEYDLKYGDIEGYLCTSPDHFKELKKHHRVLHERLGELERN